MKGHDNRSDREYYESVYANKFYNLDHMVKFHKICKLSKWTQEETK